MSLILSTGVGWGVGFPVSITGHMTTGVCIWGVCIQRCLHPEVFASRGAFCIRGHPTGMHSCSKTAYTEYMQNLCIPKRHKITSVGIKPAFAEPSMCIIRQYFRKIEFSHLISCRFALTCATQANASILSMANAKYRWQETLLRRCTSAFRAET